ncbi:MAG: AEC family transporter [Candidatus Bathyarchaeia archaeon]
MDFSVTLRTVIPIFLLIGLGFISKKTGILKTGDERVLSAYVYYFALPALFFINLAEVTFTEENIKFVVAGITPILIVIAVYLTLYATLRFSRDTLYLLILSTVFGSLAFFGIPFVMFAFPDEGEPLATLAASSISIISVATSIVVLELYRLENASPLKGLKTVGKKLSRNPLIISILLGFLASLLDLNIPDYISIPLHMLGGTTATVAVFMLGAFFYGRHYANLKRAFQLSLLRMLLLPLIGLAIAAYFNLPPISTATLVIMHSVPVAVSMIVLSERYNFYKETIASLILISSLSAGLYLNLWLLFLNI